MARLYSVIGKCVTTSGGSTTLPLGCLISTAAIRTRLYEVLLGNDETPVDQAFKFQIQRQSSAGTWAGSGGAALTPQALDPADPAAVTIANQGICSAGPTLTAGAFLLQIPMNQRNTFRWTAYDGRELVAPATANNGLSLLASVGPAATPNIPFMMHFTE